MGRTFKDSYKRSQFVDYSDDYDKIKKNYRKVFRQHRWSTNPLKVNRIIKNIEKEIVEDED